MKYFYILLVSLLTVNGAIAQSKNPCESCLPEGITFTTQTQIDDFQTNYPNCTRIEGEVWIQGGNHILNLNGLSALTSLGDCLCIMDNFVPVYTNGLENITEIGGDLWIENNDALYYVNGLINLQSIGGWIDITNNYYLQTPSGLDNIDATSITGLTIRNNYNLPTCEVQSICDYLASPNGTIEIYNNAIGCNSQVEVEAACAALGVKNLNPVSSLTIYPNPSSTTITIETPAKGIITIHNTSVQQLLQQDITKPTTTIDVSGWKSGVYFARVRGEKNVSVGKFVKE